VKIAIVAGSTAYLPVIILCIAPYQGLAGVAGFEPAHDGIKTRCLTTWLHPIILNRSIRASQRVMNVVHFAGAIVICDTMGVNRSRVY
jgi:hypothetical protein